MSVYREPSQRRVEPTYMSPTTGVSEAPSDNHVAFEMTAVPEAHEWPRGRGLFWATAALMIAGILLFERFRP